MPALGIIPVVLEVEFRNIHAEVPIVGFTGALGSGCTYLAQTLGALRNYAYYSLSAPIHKEADNRGLEHSYSTLQDIGDELRRENGRDFLVKRVLQQANSS